MRERDALPPSARDAGPPSAREVGPPSARDTLPPQRPGSPLPSARAAAGAVEVPVPSREVTVDDVVWVVRQKGSGRVGYGRGSGARILSVGVEAHADGESPDATRYVLAHSLKDVSEDELASIVREVIQPADAESGSPDRGERASHRRGRSHGHRRNIRGRRR